MRPHRFRRPEKSIALRYRTGIALTLLLAAAIAAGSAYADGIVTSSPPLSTLVKFGERQYQIAYSEDVSLEPTQTVVVRKIGFGRIETVNIATTASGTYSSDGLTSPYIQYPGISVSEVPSEAVGAFKHREPGPGFSIFSLGSSPNGGLALNAVSDSGVRSCLARGSIISCYRTY